MENQPDEAKTAEARAYSRGYQAGRKRRKTEVAEERRLAQRQAFWQRAFLAALPACVTAQGWAVGDKPITNISQRTRLAKDFADEATKLAYGDR